MQVLYITASITTQFSNISSHLYAEKAFLKLVFKIMEIVIVIISINLKTENVHKNLKKK